MEKRLLKKVYAFLITVIFVFIGCQESVVEPDSTEPTTDREAFLKIIEEDSSLSTFISNYNEEEAMSFLSKTETEIYPFRVGHKVRMINKNLDVDFQGDTAYATLTRTFEGILFIAASYDSSANHADTLITKPFTSQVVRNLIFIKIDSTQFPFRNWRIAAISLPEGGTIEHNNIDIQKITVVLPEGDEIIVEDPLSYYLSRRPGWGGPFPIVPRFDSVLIKVELYSSFEENDFVTLTYGADRRGMNRHKRKFDLVSSTPFGDGFIKIYQQYFRTRQWPGHYHAIINAFPGQVIFDDAAHVENEMWGIPYKVKP